ncbi:MAG: peptide chain release factor-like protein [Verrucomicrobiaceae bacterium]|nr:peptide chain release factor-like protein [Verrucomicrobiaceae bacterium]
MLACMADLPDDSSLLARMTKLRIREDDLEESFIRGSGAGGQKINKTSSTVVLRHIPSGIEVRCQRERSQSQNRLLARHELCGRLESIFQQARLDEQNEREKKRRQTRERPRGLKRRYVAGKRHRAEIKQGRGKVGGEE